LKRLENSSSDSEEKKEEDEKGVNEIEEKRIGKGDWKMKFDVRDKLYIKIFGGVNGILANIINIE